MFTTVEELFSAIKWAETEQDKINILRKNRRIINLLKLAYDESEYFTKEMPDYYVPGDNMTGISYSNLFMEDRRFYLFQIGNPRSAHLTEAKRKELQTSMLESFTNDEARVVIAIFNKNLTEYGITPELVKQAFPDIF